MAEVTWIKGHIDPPESKEYYVALEALTNDIPGFSKGDIEITGDYWTGEDWQSLGKNNPFWRVLCWADVLRPNIPDGLNKRVRRYFGFTVEREE